MKKLFTLVLFGVFFLNTRAQISFLTTDVPLAPWAQKIVTDSLPLPVVSYGNKGANQFYDFSNLVQYKTDTIEYRTPTSAHLSTCPQADVATTLDGLNFLLTNTTTSNMTLEGFEGVLFGNTLSAAYQTKPVVYQFPMNYNTNFMGNFSLTKTVPGSQVGQPGVYQVRLTISGSYKDTVDGWGAVKTPIGTYKCLRNKRNESTTTLIETQISQFIPVWTTVSNTTSNTVRYTYLTKECKGSAVTFDYDSLDNLRSVTYSQIPPNAPIADFSFTNGSSGLVNFTDLSDNYPTSWSWTFGDGGTSTQQNPLHTYAANGTYTVCLTATNAGGSSTQVCKQVTVSNIVTQPVANFSWVNPSGGLVNFTDLSTNTPTSWLWNFGDASPTSTSQNPNHIYAANNTYNVCLTATNTAGSNQVCKSVVVTGVSGGGNNKPVALDDTVSLQQGTSITIFHVATNDVDPDGDNICMTSVWGSPYVTEYIGGSCDMVSIVPDTSFVGTDTAYYEICDNGTPVLCDTGMIVFAVNGNPSLYPVAVDDAASVLQPDGGSINVTGNDINSGGAFCITSIYPSSSVFSINGCDSITYSPDSTFTGNDTVWYVICDNSQPTFCDTAKLVITSQSNPALLPVANLRSYMSYCQGLFAIDESTNSDSSVLSFQSSGISTYPDTVFYNQDSVNYNISEGGVSWQICLTVYNQFGSTSVCDTVVSGCLSISEVQLGNVSLYPNPTNNQFTIDMSNNTDAAVLNYKTIDIYNALGELVIGSISNKGRVVSVSVADLPSGMYVATLTDANGIRKTLGRFVKE